MAADKKAEKKEEAGGDEAEAKRKKKKLIMMIVLGVVLMAVTIGGTLLAVKLMSPKNPDSESASEDGHSSDASDAASDAPAIYFALKPNFTVNYDVNGRQRFLQTEITLMFRDAAVQKILELHMPTVRNGLVMLLSRQVFEELQTTEGKEKLRSEALETIQEIITKENTHTPKDDKKEEKAPTVEPVVEQVLFTQFVMQ